MVKNDSHNNQKTPLWQQSLLAGIVSALVLGVLTLAFLWPAKTATPQQVPIGITGPNKQQTALVARMIETNAEGKVDLVEVSSRDDAISKMQHRETYGTIIVSANPEVLTASANGAAVNGVVTSLATVLEQNLAKHGGQQVASVSVTKTDVIPAHSATFDISQLSLPMVLGGTVGSVLVLALTRSRWSRLAALGLYSVFAGVTMYLILHTWFNVIPSGFWAVTGVFSLGTFAIGSFVGGLYALLGTHGIGLAAALNLLVANPISGLMVPAIFMPWIWGTIGQLLIIGAIGTLLRGVLYFPVSEVLTLPIIVLAVWSALGVGAILARDHKQLKS